MSMNEAWYKSLTNFEENNKLSELAAKVAVQNFDYRYATLLFFNTTLCYGVELFLQVFNYNVIINREMIVPKLINITRQYVIFTSDVLEFQQMLDTLKEMEVINTGKFIIICQSRTQSDCDENEMTKLFWEHKIVDVVVIKSKEDQALGYTYFPISDGDCNNVKPIELKLSNCSQCFTTNHGNMFGMKLKKLNSCPLIVSTFIQTPYMQIIGGTPFGADGDLMRILGSGLNASIAIITPRHGDGWGFHHTNGTWTGSLADIYDDLANISMTSAALTESRFSGFQISHSYYTIRIVWITHPAALQDQALKLLHPFEQSTRIALILSYILVILCAFIIKTEKWSSICRKIQADQPSKSIVFYSWMICMGQAVIKPPTKYAFLHILLLWVYYCFIIRTAYQVYLISSLKGKFYNEQFDTIEDAINANYPFGGGAALRDYYKNYPIIYDNWVNIDTADIVPTALNISKGHKFVLAMNRDTAKIIIKKHKVKLHILPQIIITSPTVIFAKKYSPIMESINLILSRLVTSGLPDKLHKKYTSLKNLNHDSVNELEKLKMKHFTACYIILAVGLILSFVFFSLELYFGKIYRHPILSP